MYLIVYRCYDNQEEEACFSVPSTGDAKDFLDAKPSPPDGFRNREGYYFFEKK